MSKLAYIILVQALQKTAKDKSKAVGKEDVIGYINQTYGLFGEVVEVDCY